MICKIPPLGRSTWHCIKLPKKELAAIGIISLSCNRKVRTSPFLHLQRDILPELKTKGATGCIFSWTYEQPA